MSYLQKCAVALQQQEQNQKTVFNYAIPELWDSTNLAVDHKIVVGDGNILVHPIRFYRQLIEDVFLKHQETSINYQIPYFLGQPDKTIKSLKNGDWIKGSFAYSMMIRSSASYDHDRSGVLESNNMYGLKETGTFIKALSLLPLLKKMGIDVV